MPPNQPSQLKPVGNAPSANNTGDVAKSQKQNSSPTQKMPAEKTSLPGLDTFKSFFTGTSANSDKISKSNAATINKNATIQITLQTTTNNLLAGIYTVLNRNSAADTKRGGKPVAGQIVDKAPPKSVFGTTVFGKKDEIQPSKKTFAGQMTEKFAPKGLIGNALFGKKDETQLVKKASSSNTEKPTVAGFIGNALFGKKEQSKQPGGTNKAGGIDLSGISAYLMTICSDTAIMNGLLNNFLSLQENTTEAINEGNTSDKLSKSIGSENSAKAPASDKSKFGDIAKMFAKSEKKGDKDGGGGILVKVITTIVEIFISLIQTALSLVEIITTIFEVIAFAIEVITFVVEAITIGASLLASGFMSLLASILPIIIALLPIIAVLGLLALAAYLIYDNWSVIGDAIGGLWDKTFGLFTGMFEKFMSGNILGGLFDWFIGLPMMFSSWILLGLKGIFNFLASIPLKLFDWIGSFLGFDMSGYVEAFTDGLDLINEGFDFVIDLFSNISTYAAPVIDVISSVFELLIGLFKDYIFGSIMFFWEIFKGAFSVLVAEIQVGIAVVMGIIDAIWGTIKIVFDAIGSIFSTLYDFVTGEISFTEMMSSIWDIISSIPMKIWDMISGVFDSVISSIGGIISGLADSLLGTFLNILNSILAPFKRIASFFGFGGDDEKKSEEKKTDKKTITPAPPVIEQSAPGPEIKAGQSKSLDAADPLKKALQEKDQLNNQNDQNKMQSIVAQTNQTSVANNATTYNTPMVSANNSRAAIRGV